MKRAHEWANLSWQACATLRLVMKSGQVQYKLAPAAVYKSKDISA